MPPAGISHKHNIRFAVAVDILARVVLIKDHAKAGCPINNSTSRVVDRGSTVVAVSLSIVGWPQRNLIPIPQLLLVGLSRFWVSMTSHLLVLRLRGNYAYSEEKEY